jgi:hypothetical protein
MHDVLGGLAPKSGVAAIALAAMLLTAPSTAAQQTTTQSLSATVAFAPRSSLSVSTRTLHFVVTDAATPAIATVEISAAARTSTDGVVTLVFETEGLAGQPGAGLEIVAGAAGAVLGKVPSQQPVVGGRWVGSGARDGRLTFQLRAQPGTYDIPVAFQLQLS